MITGVLCGRLGNQMFQYAVTRTIAEDKGYDYVFRDSNPPLWKWQGENLFRLLNVPTTNSIGQHIFNEVFPYDTSINDIGDHTELRGFFQNEKYFDHVKTRSWFLPNPFLNTFIYNKDTTCVINVRGGDYIDLAPHFLLPSSYYEEAKVKMLSINPDLQFIVVTDDPDRARNLFPDYPIIREGVHSDFLLLYTAKYFIIANSTFSWWAAWLNEDNTVIAPKGWLNYNRDKDVFIPSGIKVERFSWI